MNEKQLAAVASWLRRVGAFLPEGSVVIKITGDPAGQAEVEITTDGRIISTTTGREVNVAFL